MLRLFTRLLPHCFYIFYITSHLLYKDRKLHSENFWKGALYKPNWSRNVMTNLWYFVFIQSVVVHLIRFLLSVPSSSTTSFSCDRLKRWTGNTTADWQGSVPGGTLEFNPREQISVKPIHNWRPSLTEKPKKFHSLDDSHLDFLFHWWSGPADCVSSSVLCFIVMHL